MTHSMFDSTRNHQLQFNYMKRSSDKKLAERRNKKKGYQKSTSSKKNRLNPSKQVIRCCYCLKKLITSDRALFVEEENGRIFCSESCITRFFSKDIDKLEKEYFKRLSPYDLSAKEKENFSDLRWITLQAPNEVWREKTVPGDVCKGCG